MICNKENCTGCFACYNICPKNAINMIEDEYGYIYPEIDEAKCINCGLCKKVCPSLNKILKNKVKKCYAAISKEKIIYETSSSGGLATTVSKKIIEDDGIVYGAALVKENKIQHIRVNQVSDLDRLKGSKYVHSYIESSFNNIKNDLKNNKKVLFIGTPCQVMGLKNFLQKDYNNLYTIDLICHGVPSQKFLRDEIKNKFGKENIDYISFRGNKGFYITLKNKNKTIEENSNKNLYYYSFLKGMTYRENCYKCQYACLERVGDLTLGDFWGLKTKMNFEHKKGINCILVNTNKGQEIINNISNLIYFKEVNINEAIEENHQLKRPTNKPIEREKILNSYINLGYKKSLKKSLGKKFKNTRNKEIIKEIIKKNKVIYGIIKKIKE